jgi:hypothetical protein
MTTDEKILMNIIDEKGIQSLEIKETKFKCRECGEEGICIFDIFPFNAYCDKHREEYLSDEPGSAIWTFEELFIKNKKSKKLKGI